ncbi:Snf7 family [Blastocladiella britannica]|nr:Snf7 family [Blastocladiella britannica]
MRKQQRELKTSERSLDRDDLQLQRQEKQVEAEIKRAARAGNQAQCRALAKQLIAVRNQRAKLLAAKTQIRSVGLKSQTAASSMAIAASLKGATKVMASANKQASVEKLQETLMGFERESMAMDMREEMMADAIDGVMDDEDDEQEGEDILSQVLDEIGIEVASRLPSAGRVPLAAAAAAAPLQAEDDEADAMVRRLEALRSV